MKKNITLVFLNTASLLAMLFINYASNARLFSEVTVADISHKYDTLFAPANYAFIIWGLIFLLTLGFVIYQWTLIKNDPKQYIRRTGAWFLISNIANALWVYCWVHEWLGYCVMLILILLFSLIVLTVKLELELYDEPLSTIFFVWWPISVYLGWVMVATIACIASWLIYSGWNNFNLDPAAWTITMLVTALLLNIFLIQIRNMRESAGTGIWAFIAIAVRQFDQHASIAFTAVIASLILIILIARHGYRNRLYLPFAKIKRGEWK